MLSPSAGLVGSVPWFLTLCVSVRAVGVWWGIRRDRTGRSSISEEQGRCRRRSRAARIRERWDYQCCTSPCQQWCGRFLRRIPGYLFLVLMIITPDNHYGHLEAQWTTISLKLWLRVWNSDESHAINLHRGRDCEHRWRVYG